MSVDSAVCRAAGPRPARTEARTCQVPRPHRSRPAVRGCSVGLSRSVAVLRLRCVLRLARWALGVGPRWAAHSSHKNEKVLWGDIIGYVIAVGVRITSCRLVACRLMFRMVGGRRGARSRLTHVAWGGWLALAAATRRRTATGAAGRARAEPPITRLRITLQYSILAILARGSRDHASPHADTSDTRQPREIDTDIS